MNPLHAVIENAASGLAARSIRRPRLCIFLVLLLTGLVCTGIPDLRIDTSTESFLPADHPKLVEFQRFQEMFGRDDLILAALPLPGKIDRGFLEKLKRLKLELVREVPYLARVSSLVDGLGIRGRGDEILAERPYPDPPFEREELVQRLEGISLNPIHRKLLVSPQGTYTTLVLELAVDSPRAEGGEEEGLAEETAPPGARAEPLNAGQGREAVEAVQRVLARTFPQAEGVLLTGGPVLAAESMTLMQSDLKTLLAISPWVMGLILLLVFRRPSGVFLPLITVVLATASTAGLMGLLGVPLNIPFLVLPTFLLAVGLCDSVHLLSLFYDRIQKGQEVAAALKAAVREKALALVLTSLTTATALASFSLVEVRPIAQLGLISAAGVMLALLYTLTLLPSLLVLIRPRPLGGGRARLYPGFLDRFFDRLASLHAAHPKTMVWTGLALVALSLIPVSQLRFSYDFLNWMPETNPLVRGTRIMDREFRGILSMEVLIDTGQEQGLVEPELLDRLYSLARGLESRRWGRVYIGGAMGLAELAAEIDRAVNPDWTPGRPLPGSRELLAQELFLYDSLDPGGWSRLADPTLAQGRLVLWVPWRDSMEYRPVIREVEQTLSRGLPGRRVAVTGNMPLYTAILEAAMGSLALGYLLAGLGILVVMVILIGDAKLGLLMMLPNLAPILWVLGILGLTTGKLDIYTMMVGSLALGLAVDDTMHFMVHFQRYYNRFGDAYRAVRAGLHKSGQAIVASSLVLAGGFAVGLFGQSASTVRFVVTAGGAVILALAADLLMAPALLMLTHRSQDRKHG